jgi:ribosomal protein S6
VLGISLVAATTDLQAPTDNGIYAFYQFDASTIGVVRIDWRAKTVTKLIDKVTTVSGSVQKNVATLSTSTSAIFATVAANAPIVSYNISTRGVGPSINPHDTLWGLHHARNESLFATASTASSGELRRYELSGNPTVVSHFSLGGLTLSTVTAFNPVSDTYYQVLSDGRTLVTIDRNGHSTTEVISNSTQIVAIAADDRASTIYAVDMARRDQAYTIGRIHQGRYTPILVYAPPTPASVVSYGFSQRERLFVINFESGLLVADVSVPKILASASIPGLTPQSVINMVYASHFT